MIRIVISVLIFAHAVAHLPGFLVSWRLRSFPELPFRTTILAGSVDVGQTGIKVVGIAWLTLSVALAIIAVGILTRAAWSQPAAYFAVGLSAGLCIVGWPDARLGLVANAVILAVIMTGARAGWL